MSGQHIRSNHQKPSHTQPSLVSSVHNIIHSGLTNYPFSLLLAFYIAVILYNPSGVVGTYVRDAIRSLFNLSPFFNWVILPIIAVYLVHYLVVAILQKYQAFLDLGHGGTPLTPKGFVKVSLKKFFARVDVLEPPRVPPLLEPYRGALFGLESREGERPIVKGVAPQRQFDQRTPASTCNRLHEMLKHAASEDDELVINISYLERFTEALKGKFDDLECRVLGTDGEWDYEIAHPHRLDSSMHVVLHPEDARTIIEHGWGEKHPLATDAWYWQTYYRYVLRKRRPVPYNLVLCYSPRNDQEFAVMKKIVDAAVWFRKERAVHERITRGLGVRLDDGTVIDRIQALDRGFVAGKDGRLVAPEKCKSG